MHTSCTIMQKIYKHEIPTSKGLGKLSSSNYFNDLVTFPLIQKSPCTEKLFYFNYDILPRIFVCITLLPHQVFQNF